MLRSSIYLNHIQADRFGISDFESVNLCIDYLRAAFLYGKRRFLCLSQTVDKES